MIRTPPKPTLFATPSHPRARLASRLRWLGAGAFALAAPLVASDPPASTPETVEPRTAIADRLVVSAGRVDQEVTDVPVKVTVLDAADLERSASRTADDFLRQLPSFNLQRPGSSRVMNNSNQGVVFRGLGGTSASRSLVLVDGVPLNEPFSGWISWSRIPLAAVERVEVVPGGAAGAWGNQSLGGVIQVFTRRPSPATVDASASWGSRETLEATVFASHLVGPVAMAAHASTFDTDGYSDVPAAIRGPADTASRSRANVVDARIQIGSGQNTLWTLQGTRLEDRRRGGTELDGETLDLTAVRAGGDLTGADGSTWRLNAFVLDRSFSSTRGSISDDRTTVEPRRDQFDVPATSLGVGLSWFRTSQSGRHLVAGGFDGLWTDAEVHEDSSWSGTQFSERTGSGGEQQLIGAYASDTVELGPRWQLAAGVRVDQWESSGGFFTVEDLETGTFPYDQHLPRRSATVASPNLGTSVRLSDHTILRAAAFQSFRAPTPNELFKSTPSSRRFLSANNQLDPERITLGTEVGLDLRPGGGATSLRITGYWNEIEDAIADLTVGIAGGSPEVIEPCGLLRAGGVCSQRQNLERVHARGLELDAETRIGSSGRFAASYAYTESKVVESRVDPSLEGKWLRRVPKHQATLQASVDLPKTVTAALQVRYQGQRFEEDLNRLVIAESVLVDLKLSRRFGRLLDLSLSVENLFDTEFEVGANDDYQELGYPRLVHLGLRYRHGAARGSQP